MRLLGIPRCAPDNKATAPLRRDWRVCEERPQHFQLDTGEIGDHHVRAGLLQHWATAIGGDRKASHAGVFGCLHACHCVFTYKCFGGIYCQALGGQHEQRGIWFPFDYVIAGDQWP